MAFRTFSRAVQGNQASICVPMDTFHTEEQLTVLQKAARKKPISFSFSRCKSPKRAVTLFFVASLSKATYLDALSRRCRGNRNGWPKNSLRLFFHFGVSYWVTKWVILKINPDEMLISPGFGREQRKGVQRAPALRASAWTRCAAVRRTAAGPGAQASPCGSLSRERFVRLPPPELKKRPLRGRFFFCLYHAKSISGVHVL